MNNENDTDTFFVTKHNSPNQKSIYTSLPSLELSSARIIRVKKDELQHLFDNYHLFKYSKCFQARKRLSMPAIERERKHQNFKSIKRESELLKDRLGLLEKERKQIFEKMKNQPK